MDRLRRPPDTLSLCRARPGDIEPDDLRRFEDYAMTALSQWK
jgi:hypothetical protein